ncbi:APC family permease [Vagococcus penaei]|uniref:APC family permease n=1 Tax=Vagococcus penaei TaxID=633807 RepID=UPI000986F04F|nr:APC family permease [Vagococcus penaei]
MVAYFEEFYSKKLASAFGWYQTFLYYPTVTVVVAWASGIYTILLLNLPDSLDLQMGIGLGYLLFFYALNILSKHLGGRFQVISSVAKLIPLIGIGLIALFWKQSTPAIPTDIPLQPVQDVGWGWLAALAPMAFSYDGWPIALSISHEVKNSKKIMPLALTIGPLIVLGVYLTYFLGMTHILGSEYIMSVGNGAVTTIGDLLIGPSGKTILLLFVLISILGVVNGVILGHLRMPYALVAKQMFPQPKNKTTQKSQEFYSAMISLGTALTWYLIHYITQKFGLLKTGDVSEIAIVFGYFYYMMLYVKVLHMYLKKTINQCIYRSRCSYSSNNWRIDYFGWWCLIQSKINDYLFCYLLCFLFYRF